MGGPTSGNWFPRCKKNTVEDALTVDVRVLRAAIRAHVADTFSVTWGMNYRKVSIGLSVEWDAARPTAYFDYSCEGEEICIPIRLESTPTNFDGERWWFTCPLIVGGVACERRVSKLYLPPRARYFGCRVCHDLTYPSCQMTRPRRLWSHAA